PPVVRGEVLVAPYLAREEAAPQRAVGDEADAQLPAHGQNLVLRVATPERVLRLERADGVRSVCTPDRYGGGLREAEIADLTGAHQLRHRADRLLDRHAPVHAVLVVEVDVSHAESRERGVAGLAHVLRAAVHAHKGPVRFADVAELGGQDDALASVRDCLADEPFVGERAVDIGRVEEGDTEVDRAMDGGDRLGVIAVAVACASAPAVRPGIEVFVDHPLALVRGKRVGLITNQSGIDRQRRSTIDLLRGVPDLTLVALYSPEHGIRGVAETRVASTVD